MVGIDVTSGIVIERSRDIVSGYVENPANDRRWIRALTRSEVHATGPFGVGTVVRRTARMPFKSLTYALEVTEYRPGEYLAMRPAGKGFPIVVDYTFADEPDGGTRVEVRNRGGAGALFRIASPLISRLVRARVGGDLRQLKQILEAEAR